MLKRLAKNKKSLEQIQTRVERRKYNAMVDQIEGFNNRKQFDKLKE
jgi:hypothetical protein